MSVVSSSECKVNKIPRPCQDNDGFFVTSPSEAEEKEGSAAEHPAGIRLLNRTGIVFPERGSQEQRPLFQEMPIAKKNLNRSHLRILMPSLL